VVSVSTAEGASAVAPAPGKDATATLGVAAVEFDEMPTSFAHIIRVRIDRGATAAAVERVLRRAGAEDRFRNRDLASPSAPHHDAIVRLG
jgi:hypothetical protein